MQYVIICTDSQDVALPNGKGLVGHRLSGVLCGNDGVKEYNLGP
jgi:hypothetical protein